MADSRSLTDAVRISEAYPLLGLGQFCLSDLIEVGPQVHTGAARLSLRFLTRSRAQPQYRGACSKAARLLAVAYNKSLEHK